MIKILQVIGNMNRGGAETMIMNLYRNIDREKVQFDFVVHTNEKAEYDEEILSLGGRIISCPKFIGTNYVQYKKWWRDFFASHKEYSIVHGHIGSTAAIYLNEAKKLGIYAVAHSHSTDGSKNLKGLIYSIFSFPTRYIADYFFSCSFDAIVNRYGKKIKNSNKIKILNNAIEVDNFTFNENNRQLIRDEFKLSDELLIGHIGRMDKFKNQSFVIDVFHEIVKKNINAKLILVGDGEDRSELEQKVKNLGLTNMVIFTGVRPDVNKLIQAMDVFVFPSIFEGLPVTLVEVQASGLPCVISDTIPNDSILIDQIVKQKSLNDSPSNWADVILGQSKICRIGRKEEIIDSGFDVKTTAKWLEEFYIGKAQ